MKHTIKQIAAILVGVFTSLFAHGQSVNYTSTALTANTAANLLAGRYVIDTITVFNTNAATPITIKFYDAATTSTNVIRPAAPVISSYETNYTTITTNAAGILNTNTFTGYISVATTSTAVTNERARLAVITVPANSTRSIPLQFITAQGFTVLPSAAGLLDLTYKGN